MPAKGREKRVAREIGSWTKQPDAKRPSPYHKPASGKLPIGQSLPGRFPPGQSASGRFSAKHEARIAKALEPGEIIVRRIPLSGLAVDSFNVGVWRSFTLPGRQAAVLTDRRVLLVSFGQAISVRPADRVRRRHGWRRPDLGIKKLLVRGSPPRGGVCLGQLTTRRRGRRKSTTYPPFTLFGVDRPLDVAARIKQTLQLDLPITDKTR